jgi:hypothetical protein
MSEPQRLTIGKPPRSVAWVILYHECITVKESKKLRDGRVVLTEAVRDIPDHKSRPVIVCINSEHPIERRDVTMLCDPRGTRIALRWPEINRECAKTTRYNKQLLQISRPQRLVPTIAALRFFKENGGNHVHTLNVVAFATKTLADRFVAGLMQKPAS